MAVTENTYTGNGSTTNYSFTFPYLDTGDIKVTLNGTLTTAYTLANATTISFTSAPVNGATIRIYRDTDTTDLKATFFSGSAIRAQDLNSDLLQSLYATQESENEASSATATANTALTNSATAVSTANTAVSTANSAVSTANTASTNASAAVATANTASTNASTAVSTANTASANATTAINTANSATTTANNAVTTANGAVSTANTALTNANSAVSTANTASTNASAAVSTANTASSNATSAVNTANTATTTANSAVNTANSAVSTANSAVTTANAAAAAVANAVLYTTVANVAAIPGSPSNNDAVEVTDSTGIESFTPLSGLPGGFVGSSGLAVRLIYQSAGSTWTWIQYFPNDPETRYLKFSGGTLTGQLLGDDSASASTPGFAFDGDANTGVGRPGADELALITGGTARLTIDSAGNVSIPGNVGTLTSTGTITGTALIPSSSTVPTNGVYLPAANTVAISTGGSGRLFVDSSGRVGIGTASPATDVHISGSGNRYFRLQSTTLGTATLGTQSSSYGLIASGDVFLSTTGAPLTFLSDGASGVIKFGTGAAASERLRIDSSGNVGVGTSSPSSLLHVTGGSGQLVEFGTGNSLRIGGFGTGNCYVKGNETTVSFGNVNAGNTVFLTGDTERARIDSSGRVGIGTSSPSQVLDVQANDARFNLTSTGSGQTVGISIKGGGGGGDTYNYIESLDSTGAQKWYIGSNGTANTLAFKTNGNNERMRIDSSGRVGIGSTSPQALLHVEGGTENAIIGSSARKLYFRADSSGVALGTGAAQTGNGFYFNEASNFIYAQTNSTERARIDSSGRLLLGTSTAYGSADNLVVQKTDAGARIGLQRSDTGEVTAGEELGAITFYSNDGDLNPSARISAEADLDHGAGDKPGRLTFSTTADGASSPTERLRIANNGQLSAVVPGNSTLYPGFMARAWVSFNGTGTVAIIGSGNVSSITDNGVGIYAVNFTTALPDGNYAVATGFKRIATSSEFVNVGFSNSTTSFNVEFFAGGGNVDTSNMQLVIFR